MPGPGGRPDTRHVPQAQHGSLSRSFSAVGLRVGDTKAGWPGRAPARQARVAAGCKLEFTAANLSLSRAPRHAGQAGRASQCQRHRTTAPGSPRLPGPPSTGPGRRAPAA